MQHFLKYIFILIFSWTITSCGDSGKTKPGPVNNRAADSIAASDSSEERDSSDNNVFPQVEYEKVFVKDADMRDSLHNAFAKTDSTYAGYRAVTCLNRKNIYHIQPGDSILIPEKLTADLILYSVFPKYYPQADTLEQIIIVSNAFQAVAAYEFGLQVRFMPTNTGRGTDPLEPGFYTLNWKDRDHRSSIDQSWKMPYTFNFDNSTGYAFHKYVLPGYPASHGCARLMIEDAKWLYEWGNGSKRDSLGNEIPRTGTPVLIIDKYDYEKWGKKGPWLYLESNRDTILPLPEEPMNFKYDKNSTPA